VVAMVITWKNFRRSIWVSPSTAKLPAETAAKTCCFKLA
jgi:hypothetical protein